MEEPGFNMTLFSERRSRFIRQSWGVHWFLVLGRCFATLIKGIDEGSGPENVRTWTDDRDLRAVATFTEKDAHAALSSSSKKGT